jgi:2-dehydro-3-deoxyphosphooctonate aldolase (KDO 8-P synthase)
VIFDATHSVQLPGGQGTSIGCQLQYFFLLSLASAAPGLAGLFLVPHDDPARALRDGPNALPLDLLPLVLEQVRRAGAAVRG